MARTTAHLLRTLLLLLLAAVPANAKAHRSKAEPRPVAAPVRDAPMSVTAPVEADEARASAAPDGPDALAVHLGQAVSARYSPSTRGTPRWSVTGAPEGVGMRDGTLVGVPAAVGSWRARVSDGLGGEREVAVDVVPELGLSQSAPLAFRVGLTPPQRLLPVDAVGPVTFEVTGLPEGVSLQPDGTFSGSPVDGAPSRGHVTVTAYDATAATDPERGARTAEGSYTVSPSLTVADYPPVRIEPDAEVDVPGPTVGGGPVNPVFAVTSGELPQGLSLDPSSGRLTGKVGGTAEATLRVTVTDDTGASAVTAPFRVTAASRLAVGGDDALETAAGTYPFSVSCKYGNQGGAYPLYSRADLGGDTCRGGWVLTFSQPVSTDGSLDLMLEGGKADATPVAYDDGSTWVSVGKGVVATRFLIEAYGTKVLHLRLGDKGRFPDYLVHVAPARAFLPARDEGTVDLGRVMPPVDGRPPYAYEVADLPRGYAFDGISTVSGTFADPDDPGLKVGHVAHVTLTDGRGTRTAPVPLVLTTSALSASTTYPIRARCRSGYPEQVWPLYADTGRGVDHCASGWVIEYALPVSSDGTLDLATSDGPLTAPVLADAGDDDWRPAVTGSTSRRFWIKAPDVEVHHLRLGDAGRFPPFLPTLAPGRVGVGHAALTDVDLRDALPPIGGAAPFTYAVERLPDGLTLVDGHLLRGAVRRGATVRATVSDGAGFASPPVDVVLQPSDGATASSTYPVRVGCRSGREGGAAPAYTSLDEPMEACRGGWVIDYGRPVTTDGSLDLLGPDGQVGARVSYDADGRGDWRPVIPGTSAERFLVDHAAPGVRHLRLGDGDVFPPMLPRLRAATATPASGGVDLAWVMPPVDAVGMVTYAVAGLPPGVSFDGRTVLSGTFPPAPFRLQVSVRDARGIRSAVEMLTVTPAPDVTMTSR